MSDIFISYSHADLDIARKIDDILSDARLDVWRDERMPTAVKFEGEIQGQLKSSRVCLFLLSDSFLSSEYCQNEVGYAEAHGIAFLPCRLDGCQPKGFLASRNYFDISYKDVFDFDSLRRRKLIREVEALIEHSREESLRSELLEFYTRLLRLAESSSEPATRHLRVVNGSQEGPSEQAIEQSSQDYEKLVKGIIDYLSDGRPLDALFATLSSNDSLGGSHLPGWRLRGTSLTQVNAATQFQVVPDFVLGTRVAQGSIIEGPVYFLQKYDYRQIWHYKYTFEGKKDTLYYLFPLLPAVAYMDNNAADMLARIGWVNHDTDQAELVFFPSKGIYRVKQVTDGYRYPKVLFTKYLSIEAARTKFGLGLSAVGNVSRPASIIDKEDQAASSVLELMYMGYRDSPEGGGALSFMLYNNHKSIAIIQSMDVIVHDVVSRTPEPPPGAGAAFIEYLYTVTLQPKKGRFRITEDNFKYAPGEIDRFTVKLSSTESGYNYRISVLIEWIDISNGRLRTIETPKEVVPFPLYTRDSR